MSDMHSVVQYPTHLEESDNQTKIGLIKGDYSMCGRPLCIESFNKLVVYAKICGCEMI